MELNNRRTFCDHCSLRADLPGFIDREHAQANADRITEGDIFECHMLRRDPSDPDVPLCLGACLLADGELKNPVKAQEPLHLDLEQYVEFQASGRRTNEWLTRQGERWTDAQERIWFGWWARGKVGSWHYLMTTLGDNDHNSVYFFFDQC